MEKTNKLSRSVKEFGVAYGFSKPTIYRLIARGLLVARKVGRRTIITGEDEASWLASLPRLSSKFA
jgi:hypothetical protein